ncbi:peptidoglycan-binding protein [Rhodobacter sp. SGA-6-6]|uniref:peptidoglycan-binding protein n=1 Tax=Rhodobacter sp. SGA-6-6 TaxID=2710882 RepID=UPI0013E9F8F2|nr:peptidoglycan-binding protein [Rhodobacter sp. SGA-6-6]NGM44997.1 peptidoglycan-binding protein [Rhodobacter sp. SGA-6-6]
MLPLFNTKAIATAAALAVAATAAAPAHAWGKKEQGFVAGALTAIIIDELIENNRHRKAAPTYREPVYRDPGPRYDTPRYGSVYSTPAAQAFNSYSRAERKAIQRSLRAYGYYHGGIDGSFGPGTYNAIVAYARASGASGHLNSAGGVYALYDGLLY